MFGVYCHMELARMAFQSNYMHEYYNIPVSKFGGLTHMHHGRSKGLTFIAG